jgi:hypothetical protein
MTTFDLLNILSKDENEKEFAFVDENRNVLSKDGALLRFHEMEIAHIYLNTLKTGKTVICIQPTFDELKKLKLKLIDDKINELMCEKEEVLNMYNSGKTEKV